MKFAIITHALHKIHKQDIFAYEPYVREMNLWLPYVNEVQIVAPFSKEAINSIESSYVKMERHPQLDWGTHEKEQELKSLRPFDKLRTGSAQTDRIVQNRVGNDGITLIPIHSFDITSIKNALKAIFKIPFICYKIYKAMQWADHIHLRCPGNIGLLGSLVQILFPSKPKTVKYAGNWDPKSQQPFSYKVQKWILSNTFLTRNCKVLVYGEWPKQSKNIVPFFTATYSETELLENSIPKEKFASSHTSRNDEYSCHPEPVEGYSNTDENNNSLRQAQTDIPKEQIASSQIPRNDEIDRHPQLDWGSHDLEKHKQIPNELGNERKKIYFLFVGALTQGKQPLVSVKVVHELKKKGYKVQLDIYGEGQERENLANYILDNSLEHEVVMHGNTSKELIKLAYQKAQFLVFISKSEGWPKVVAEAMCWGCLPISSNVSCVPYMLGHGTRGAIVNPNIDEIVSVVEGYIKDRPTYNTHVQNGMEWSRQFTLEKFAREIGKLLQVDSPLERG
jgi:glycosyltransferase involved in cell wall biosynthesis